MTSIQDVTYFLQDFHIKMKIWGILYRDDRNKNTQTLTSLEIPRSMRDRIIEQLQEIDFCEGPYKDTLYSGSEMWVFGKEIKGIEIYIKITIGIKGSEVICISFHIAEHSLIFPFKK